MSEYNGNLIHIIVKVPEDTVACEITAKMLVNGKLEEAHAEIDAELFRQARKDFLDNVEDGDEYDQVYYLTEKGKEWLDKREGDADDNG